MGVRLPGASSGALGLFRDVNFLLPLMGKLRAMG